MPCILTSILFLLDSSTGCPWQNFTHRALLMAMDCVMILINAGDLGRIWSSVFYWQWTLFFVGIHLACLALQNKECSTASFPFFLSFLLPCQALWREGLPAIRFTSNTQLWFHLHPVAGAVWGCFYPSSRTPEGELNDSTLDSRSSQWSSVSGQSLLSKGV